MFRILVATWAVVATITLGPAQARKASAPVLTAELAHSIGPFDSALPPEARFTLAATNTTVLANYSFDAGATCNAQSWTVVDATAQAGTFWHVDDFAGVNVDPADSYAPLDGTKSLWCGVSAPSCSYATIPGYGNNWNQTWETQACIPVTGDLDVSFLVEFDSEPHYDATFLEYTTVCAAPKALSDWQQLDGGIDVWDGKKTLTFAKSYPVAGNPVRVRLRFISEGAYSDEDGVYNSHAGPVVIDDLQVEGLALEDFEGEAVGATMTEDWEAGVIPGYGASYMALFPGAMQLQRDACARDISCVWAAISGSTETYACGGFPQQAAVPKGNAEGQYLDAEIWSPPIALVGTGNRLFLQYSAYREQPLDNLVFDVWGIRTVTDGCTTPWRTDNFLYHNDGGRGQRWVIETQSVGTYIDLSASHIQVKLGVVDMCPFFCGEYGTGACHSHTPLFDNVRVYRVDIVGPQWTTRDYEMFQDTFPSDGTGTGIGRADMASSISNLWDDSPIVPGDSCVVFSCSDPFTATEWDGPNPTGLADDLALGGKQVYIWVHVLEHGVPSATKTGAVLTDTPGQYPYKDTQVAFGKTWTRIRCELVPIGNSTRFRVDLNDNLFEAGDVIEFFFGATNTNGETSYCSGTALNYVQSDVELAAETASEFSILPVNANLTELNELLYVDGMDGRGAQVYWDIAFQQMGRNPDRYDVRGPLSAVGNRPGSRVTDAMAQLNDNYQMIIWDCGDLYVTLGGAGANPTLIDKSDDFAMINDFLDGLTSNGGVYICGDDFPQRLAATTDAAAGIFKSNHITFTLTTGDHRPTYGIAPTGTGTPGGAFRGDTWVVYGGCPLLNDFDVMAPTVSTFMHSSYNTPAANNGAEIGKIGPDGNEHVMIAGYSFIYIRDDETDGTVDRARHLYDLLSWLSGAQGQPIGIDPVAVNRLEQNYPNPFNPQTTIAFSIRERGHVRIDVYDVAGQHVKTLLDETRAAGSYTDVRWDGSDGTGSSVASGIYFYRLTTEGFSQTRKMVLLK